MSQSTAKRRHELWRRICMENWVLNTARDSLLEFIACIAMNRSLIKHHVGTLSLFDENGTFIDPRKPFNPDEISEPTAQEALYWIMSKYANVVETLEELRDFGDDVLGLDYAYQVLRVFKEVHTAVETNLEDFEGSLHQRVKQWMNVHVRGKDLACV